MQRVDKCTQMANEVEYSENSMQIDDTSNNVSPPIFRALILYFDVSRLPGLINDEDIDSFFEEIKTELQSVENVVKRKKAYKVLLIILKDNLVHWRKIAGTFLPEIILSLEEGNKKTRNRAYSILVEIAHEYGDEERDGNRESLCQFYKEIASGLTWGTHMISATAKGLACLAYEFSDLVSTAFEFLPFIFPHLLTENKEIIKANLGLLKVLVDKSPVEVLHTHLRLIVEGLFLWQDNTKNPFKAKVELLLGMLVTKCGLEAVKAVMPEEHMKLLYNNMHKIKEQKQRNRGAKSEETRSRLSKATTCRSNIRLKKNLGVQLCDQLGDEPLDLLDLQKTRSALRSLNRKSSTLYDDMEVDSEGCMIIREEEGEGKKEKSGNTNVDIRNEADRDSHLSVRCGSRGQKQRKRSSHCGWAYTGKEYASKKAGGDVMMKGKLEPYAYWRLDRKLTSHQKHHRDAARRGMASVVMTTRKLQGKSASGVVSLKSLKLKRIGEMAARKRKYE